MKSILLRGSLLASALVLACAMATPASAKARHHAKAHQDMVPWHGWGDSFPIPACAILVATRVAQRCRTTTGKAVFIRLHFG